MITFTVACGEYKIIRRLDSDLVQYQSPQGLEAVIESEITTAIKIIVRAANGTLRGMNITQMLGIHPERFRDELIAKMMAAHRQRDITYYTIDGIVEARYG